MSSLWYCVQALVSVSTIGAFESRSDESLATTVKEELEPWFGAVVKDWRLLRNYRIPYAQPNQVKQLAATSAMRRLKVPVE